MYVAAEILALQRKMKKNLFYIFTLHEQTKSYFLRAQKSHKASNNGNLQFSHCSATAPVHLLTPADAWCLVFQRHSDT